MNNITRRSTLKLGLGATGLLLMPSHLRAAEFTFKVAHDANVDHPFQKGYENFKEVVEKLSGGRIRIDIFPAAQLGAEDTVNELVTNGLVLANMPSAASGLSTYVPDIDALNFPFLFKSVEHFYRVIDGEVGKTLAKKVENKLGSVVVGWTFNGARNVWNGVRPIVEPKDLEGLKLRVINTPIMLSAFQQLGVQVTPMAFSEVYNALQQKVIDGAENDNVDIQVEKFYEVTKYVSLTRHLFLSVAMILSKRVLSSLPADLQEVTLSAAREGLAETRKAVDDKAATSQQFLESKGLVFNDVNLAAFQAAAEPIYASAKASSEVLAMVRKIGQAN